MKKIFFASRKKQKPKTALTIVKVGLEWAFLLSALLVVIMPFTGLNTFARGNDTNRMFAGTILVSALKGVGDSPEEQEELREQVQRIAGLVDKDSTDLNKVKTVHDWMVRNTVYDYVNVQNNTLSKVSYTAYGALVRKSAVCQGYALAFEKVMQEVNIPCVTVVSDDLHHAWNMVNIDGEWYHVDVTRDDPVPDMKDYVSYDYFLLSDAQMQAQTEMDKIHWVIRTDAGDRPAPQATNQKYDSMTQRDWMYGYKN